MISNNKIGDNATITIGDNNKVKVKNNIKRSKNNLDDLIDFFKNSNMPEEDITALKVAIEKDGDFDHKKGYGKHIKSWIGNTVSKAAGSLWDISITKASEVIEDGLSSYFGI